MLAAAEDFKLLSSSLGVAPRRASTTGTSVSPASLGHREQACLTAAPCHSPWSMEQALFSMPLGSAVEGTEPAGPNNVVEGLVDVWQQIRVFTLI